MIIGYTPGGSPIFFGGPSLKKTKKRVLYKCSGCNNRATKNQAKSAGGKCFHCGSWLRAFKPND